MGFVGVLVERQLTDPSPGSGCYLNVRPKGLNTHPLFEMGPHFKVLYATTNI